MSKVLSPEMTKLLYYNLLDLQEHLLDKLHSFRKLILADTVPAVAVNHVIIEPVQAAQACEDNLRVLLFCQLWYLTVR